MLHPENLKTLTPEEAREQGRKGGIASAAKRKEKKALRATLEALLDMPINEGVEEDLEGIQNLARLKGANIDVQTAVMFAQIKKALKGDTRAAEFIRDTIGQKPGEKVDMSLAVPIFYGEDDIPD